VCSGMNPCYYMKENDELKVSSSVASLILESGRLELDQSFKPPRFFLHPWQRNTFEFLRNSVNVTEKALGKSKFMRGSMVTKIKSAAPAEMKKFIWNPHRSSHVSQNSIDLRIKKLSPFESVTANDSSSLIKLDCSLSDVDSYLEQSAKILTKTINEIEAAFPKKKHIILMGGKDSQLIGFIPKLDPSNWYIFSAEPNYSLLTEWVAENDVAVNKIISHDGRNEETIKDMKRKVICGDLYTNIIHVRYLPSLEKLVQEFGGECIFWSGSMARNNSLYDASYRNADKLLNADEYFASHLNTFPGWQGNIHQMYSNYLKCPFLSPYYLETPWLELYAHLDPSILEPGVDYRPRLADLLAGRKISWPSTNPGPKPYEYWNFWFNSYRYYVSYIRNSLKSNN
jgi:hypothetical protein